MALLALTSAGPARAQTSTTSSTPMLTLYVDPSTGQVFTRPGRGRSVLTRIPAAAMDPGAIEKRVEQKTQAALQQNQQQISDLVKKNDALAQSNAQLEQQVADIKPAWRQYIEGFQNKFRVGTLVYGDYRFYTHTGFGPQELTQLNAPGPGNNNFNSFDISRAYLNFLFFPTDDWTIRVTPNIYRMNGSAPNDGFGHVSAIGSNLSGNMGYRLKYAYAQYSKLFDWAGPLKGDTIQAGFIPNPLVGWEEDLFGYRYVTLTPWNYLSLSSTQPGISISGPIKFNELQYVDYEVGVYDNANFHQYEQTDTKQVMGRVSVYPFGAKWRFDGLGMTFFYDYGYGNVTPDFVGGAPFYNAPKAHITRAAALLHYTAENWGIIAEYDWGHNAFAPGNLFSSSGPASFFGTGTAYADYAGLTKALLGDGKTTQSGWDVMGHYHIPNTPFTLFGLFEWFQPNTKVNLNPMDFQRWVAGVSYQYNEYLRFALDTQNLSYYHNQMDFSKAYANSFAPVFTPGTGAVENAVGRDIHAFFLNMEFSY